MLLLWLSLVVLWLPSLALEFSLKHVHHAHPDTGRILWADAGVSVASGPGNVHTVDTRPLTIQKPVSHDGWKEWRDRRRGVPPTLRTSNVDALDWQSYETIGPATDKRETLLALAKMTNNAYFRDSRTTGWYGLGGNWTSVSPSFPLIIGYDPSTSGFRGHVFLSSDNKTAVLSIKGTSAIVFGGSATVLKDKLNDNLLFSCCCARVDWTWTPVCGCFRGGGRCDQQCVEESLVEESLFYGVGVNLYNNLTFMYPDAQIWVIGHSLGGSLASLVGATFGAPVVAFEAPGERLAAQRLHLPVPDQVLHITHVYNTADPIAMGACTGPTSVCYQAGYAMETRCHLGTTIVYDTLSLLHWSSDMRSHFIGTIIDQMLDEDWSTKPDKEKIVEVPRPSLEVDCTECFNWEFGDFHE
ncbi:Alpha/Beta hydrolase protein [Rhizoctonia solani]|nr:Alpha/Beta hydrolase protein [Rhizoctonia solani]